MPNDTRRPTRIITGRRNITGFVPRNPTLHTAYNRAIGVLALILVSPFLLVISAALFFTQGASILYAGPRLGKDRQPFDIYKFRTLDTERARIVTANRVLPANSNLETPLGKFLRATRLDELPQLFNVARGDMNIVGPRPVREAIAAAEEAKNPHYSIRFSVKPGLVGPTQAYMSHGTSKALRAKYNYGLCVNHVNMVRELALFLRVGLAVLGKSARLIVKKLAPARPMEEAASEARKWDLHVVQGHRSLPVLAVTENGLSLADRAASGPADLLITTRSGGLRRAKIDLAPVSFSTNPVQSHTFRPTTELSAHLIARFLKGEAVVSPRAPRRLGKMPTDAMDLLPQAAHQIAAE